MQRVQTYSAARRPSAEDGGGSNLRMPASHAVDEPEDWDRYANFGANWMGNMNKIPRNKHCSVIWEVT